jgi:hypothetical protein
MRVENPKLLLKNTLTVLAGAGLLLAAPLALGRAPEQLNMTGKREQAMQQCPSAVQGAQTKAVDTADGVELNITARKETTRQEVRKRAHRQEEISMQGERGALEHTGQGTGSGRFGFCPGMSEDTRVQAIDTSDGVQILVRANSPESIKRLQDATHQRLTAMRKQQGAPSRATAK